MTPTTKLRWHTQGHAAANDAETYLEQWWVYEPGELAADDQPGKWLIVPTTTEFLESKQRPKWEWAR